MIVKPRGQEATEAPRQHDSLLVSPVPRIPHQFPCCLYSPKLYTWRDTESHLQAEHQQMLTLVGSVSSLSELRVTSLHLELVPPRLSGQVAFWS